MDGSLAFPAAYLPFLHTSAGTDSLTFTIKTVDKTGPDLHLHRFDHHPITLLMPRDAAEIKEPQ